MKAILCSEVVACQRRRNQDWLQNFSMPAG